MVRLGFVLVYLGFGYGLLTVWFAWRRLLSRSTNPETAVERTPGMLVTAGAAVATIGALGLPAISGFADGTKNGWQGLDPLSSVAMVIIAATLVGLWRRPVDDHEIAGAMAVSLAASNLGIVGGNTVIQTFTDRATQAEYGLVIASAAAAISLIAASTELMRRRGT